MSESLDDAIAEVADLRAQLAAREETHRGVEKCCRDREEAAKALAEEFQAQLAAREAAEGQMADHCAALETRLQEAEVKSAAREATVDEEAFCALVAERATSQRLRAALEDAATTLEGSAYQIGSYSGYGRIMATRDRARAAAREGTEAAPDPRDTMRAVAVAAERAAAMPGTWQPIPEPRGGEPARCQWETSNGKMCGWFGPGEHKHDTRWGGVDVPPAPVPGIREQGAPRVPERVATALAIGLLRADLAARIRALPLVLPEWPVERMRESCARLVEGLEPLPWGGAQEKK